MRFHAKDKRRYLVAYLAISLALLGPTISNASPIGTNEYEVTQSNLDKFDNLSNLGISGLDAGRSIQNIPLLAVGPASKVDGTSSSFSVNGLVIFFDGVTETVGSKQDISSISEGDYLAVAGEIVDSGTGLATIVYTLTEPYSPGASPAYVRTILEKVNPASGSASAGGSTIDYQGSLYDAALSEIASGDEAEFHWFHNHFQPSCTDCHRRFHFLAD